MKCFKLKRHEDVSGVSGTGLIAEGIQFSNGKCAIAWLTEYSSMGFYDSIKDVASIHCHDGKTDIVWVNIR